MNSENFEFIKTSFSRIGNTAFTSVLPKDYPSLQHDLLKSPAKDPYSRSMAYYAMTGRHGLWKVEREGDMVLICRHPNVDSEFLIFSPMGNYTSLLVTLIVKTFSRMGISARLARVENDHVDGRLLRPVPEDVLDWTYPVRILNTRMVANHAGGGFQHFRQKLNRLDFSKVQAQDFITQSHRAIAMQIIARWAEGDVEKIGPYVNQFELFNHLPMYGRIVHYDSAPVGLSIWEQTDPSGGCANAYTHLALHDIVGASQFVFLDMCRVLSARGYDTLCIGGSEDEGLDRFKRNLCPVESLALSSWVARDVASDAEKKPYVARTA